jgi:hypothetical protein
MIRLYRTKGVPLNMLARQFHVSVGTIQAIQAGAAYREEERKPVVYSGSGKAGE